MEPVHKKVVEARDNFEKSGKAIDLDPALCSVAGQAFVNRSDFI